MKPRTVACPRCGASVAWRPDSRFRPFCSERCKLIDFGGWASEAYRIPDPIAADTEAPVPPPDEP